MKMNIATIKDTDNIYKVFQKFPSVFPHIRKTYIQSMIDKQQCIYDSGIIIIFNQYKKRNKIGTVVAPAGAYTIKQIVNAEPGKNDASGVLNAFLSYATASDIYLSVREENTRAIAFYKKNDFEKVGTISWSKGNIPGIVMYHQNNSSLNEIINI